MTKEEYLAALNDLDERAKKELEINHLLKERSKSRLMVTRGCYYSEANALRTRREIVKAGALTESRPIPYDPFRKSANTAILMYRMGLVYLRENLDLDGFFEEWSRNYQFSRCRDEIFIQAIGQPLQAVTNTWHEDLLEYVRSDKENDFRLSFLDIENFVRFTKVMKTYPGLVIKQLKGMQVVVGYPESEEETIGDLLIDENVTNLDPSK